MSHAWDYDDTYDPAPLHAGCTSIPTAMAIAEIIERVDGKDIITAIATGVEFAVRLSKSCKVSLLESGWHHTALHGNFIAAAVAGKLLKLDEEALVNALGIVYHQAAGNIQCMHDGALTKRMGPGFAVRNGIMAALMAKNGITGVKNVLQGRHGFFKVYHGGEYSPEILTAKLGERYEMTELSFKPYPCCRDAHASIDATLAIIREHKINAAEVSAIKVYVNEMVKGFLCEPLSVKQNPRTIVDAQFSIPWTVALAIANGRVSMEGFTKEAISDKSILTLSNEVRCYIDDSITNEILVSPARIEITMKDGEVFSKRIEIPYGSPTNPMSMSVCAEKLKDCALQADRPSNKSRVENLIELLYQFENVDDVKKVVQLLNWSE
jgi:2-methylcitrate dehydratase PrpD